MIIPPTDTEGAAEEQDSWIAWMRETDWSTIDIYGSQDDAPTPTFYGDVAPLLRADGWCNTLPLPALKKFPPPSTPHKFTGYDAVSPDDEQIERWCSEFRGGNTAIRLPERVCVRGTEYAVIGIDVDDYEILELINGEWLKKQKTGLRTLSWFVKRCGPLPLTIRITSRSWANGSGVRLFLVPVGWTGNDELKIPGEKHGYIDVIQPHHRYVLGPGSVHPDTGAVYRVYDEVDGTELPSGRLPLELIPELPAPWLADLRRDNAQPGREGSSKEVDAFGREHTANEHPHLLTALCAGFRTIEDRSDIRNATRDALFQAAREARAGCYPWNLATSEIRSAATEAYQRCGSSFGPRQQADFDRSARYAVADATGRDLSELEDRVESGLAKTLGFVSADMMRRAKKVFEPGGAWHPGSLGWLFPNSKDATAMARLGLSASRPLADVTPVRVRWLWKGWLPLGKASIFEGDPDVGKSTVTIDWAATVSTGRPWPTTIIDDKALTSQHDPAGVLLVGAEDDYEDTVVPRLIAAGADLTRVHALNRPVDAEGKPVPFTIPNDIDWLRKAVSEANAKLVVIDPITACLPDDTKHGVDANIRRILMHVADLAAELDCAVVMIRHFNKAAGMSAKHRGGGSIAYTAVVRSVISAAKLTEVGDNGETFAIARTKGNLSKPPATLGYRIEDAPETAGLPQAEDDDLAVGVVRWCGVLDLDADQLVGADGAKVSDARKRAPVREECEAILRQLLADGPMTSEEATSKTRAEVGCSAKPVKDAATHMRIVKKPVRVDGKIDHWTWELPPTEIRLEVPDEA